MCLKITKLQLNAVFHLSPMGEKRAEINSGTVFFFFFKSGNSVLNNK